MRPGASPAAGAGSGPATGRPGAARRRPGAQRGVTLVELVVVLVLMGLLASLGATLVGRLIADRQASHGRLMLALAADAAQARIADEVQNALPNSLRVVTNAAGTWIEWVPVRDAGRYRQAADTASADPGDPLDLEDPGDTSFDVVGTPLDTPAADSQLVLHNLDTPEADVYAGGNRRGSLSTSLAGRRLHFAAAGALPAGSPGARFFVAGPPVTVACVAVAGGHYELRRYAGYGWSAAQPAAEADFGTVAPVLLLGELRGCSAAYGSALANIGLLNLRLAAGDADDSAGLDFLLQLAVDNTP